MNVFTVVGGGSWGTTIAKVLSEKGFKVKLWVRNKSVSDEIKKSRVNKAYLPEIKLPQNLVVTTSLKTALKDSTVVVSAVPSHGVRDVFKEASRHIKKGAIIVSASKGIEENTLLTPSSILKEVLPKSFSDSIVAFSGPTFAREVSMCLPSAICSASEDELSARLTQEAFSTWYLRVYTNRDPIGVEIGGAVKNVIAIAAGISDGLKLGNNARAALITRGLAEIQRLGVKMGAKKETFYGLSGLGDLALTCTGVLSRNHTVGMELGRGKTLDNILKNMNMVAEGVRTTSSVKKLSELYRVEMPIVEQIYNVLYKGKSARSSVMELMTRNLKTEA